MIKKGLKLLLFIFICAVVMIYLRFGCEDSNAIDVMPKVVGSASTDTVRINFGTIDTTYYPAVLDADSLIILIYPPDNAAPESTADGGTGVFNLTTGYYQYHRRGSNATPDLGVYTVCVKAWRGSAVRGIGVCSYLVTGAGTYHYGVQDSTRDEVVNIDGDDLDGIIRYSHSDSTLQLAGLHVISSGTDDALLLDASGSTTGKGAYIIGGTQIATPAMTIEGSATAPALHISGVSEGIEITAGADGIYINAGNAYSSIKLVNPGGEIEGDIVGTVDSVTSAALCEQDSGWITSFKDSVENSVHDNNKPNYKATGFATAADGDSVIQAIADANKPNFYNWSDAQRDSVLNTIEDANKVNYMRWTAAQRDSVLNTIEDANKANFMANLDSLLNTVADANKVNFMADVDSILQAIADANKPNFRATGFATASDLDSVNQAIADANKPNFMADVDSILQAIADANKANFMADVDSILQAIADANKPNFKATGFATAADGDSVIQAIADANKPNFKATGFATSADGDSIIQAIADANKPNFYNWSNAQRDSILNTVEDANKVNYMRWTATQRDSVVDFLDSAYAHLDSFFATTFGGASNWSNAQRDSVLDYVDSAYAHIDSFFATTFGGASNWSNAQRDSVLAYIDSAYAHLDSFFATDFRASCSGWGAYTVTLVLLDDSDSTAVAGVKINIYDSTSGVWQAGHLTPATGIRQFSLDASTYTIHLQDPPNSITSPEYMTISADTTDTFWVTVFDPGTPPSGDMCRVWCLVSDLSAVWLWGCRLSIEIQGRYHPVTLSGTPVSPYSVSGVSNDTGYVYVDVYESGELTGRTGAGTVKMNIRLVAPNGDLIIRTKSPGVEIPDAVDYEIVW